MKKTLKRFASFITLIELFKSTQNFNFSSLKENDYIDAYFDNGENYGDDDGGGGDDDGPVY